SRLPRADRAPGHRISHPVLRRGNAARARRRSQGRRAASRQAGFGNQGRCLSRHFAPARRSRSIPSVFGSGLAPTGQGGARDYNARSMSPAAITAPAAEAAPAADASGDIQKDKDEACQPVIVVTGLSGAGRSTALRTLEDLGYEAVDNLPLAL